MKSSSVSRAGEAVESKVDDSSTRPSHASRFTTLLSNQALWCSLALVVCTLSSRPFVEMGVNDDWSYIRSALHLAQTGRIAYFGWDTPILGWQIYLGALFITIFGFSFSVARLSVLFVGAVTVYLLHRILVRCGINERNATIGTLAFALSPLFMPLAFSFMTDVPGLFSLLLCIYLCLRALQAVEDTAAFNWVIFAAASNVISGFVRQTAWLGVIVIVPTTFWLLRYRRLPRVKAALLWLTSLLCIFACLTWFRHQPFAQREDPVGDILTHLPIAAIIKASSHFVLCIPLLLFPVLAAFITPSWIKTRRARLSVFLAVISLGAAVLAGLFLHIHLHHAGLVWLAPWGVNYVTPRGLIDFAEIGVRPIVFGPIVRAIVTLLVLGAALACIACVSTSPVSRKSEGSTGLRILSGRELAFFLAPFTIVYFALILPRGAVGEVTERYLLPLLVVVLITVLRLFQQKVAARLPAFSLVCVLLVAAYSVAAMHDLYAVERARLAAANEIRAAGFARTSFYGGMAYDGWTQIDSWGYVTAPKINLPPGPQPTPSWKMTSWPCGNWFAGESPAIQPRFAVSYDQGACQGPSRFAPVPYRTWLPPYTGSVYIVTITIAP